MWSIIVLGLVHPSVRTAFEAHHVDGTLGVRGVRRCLGDLGADVDVRTAHKLLQMYEGETTGVDVHGMQRIVDETAVASPVKLWLVVDPDGTGVRGTRRAWNKFGKAGTLTPFRIAHYGTGLASLGIGTIDYVDYVTHSAAMQWHGGDHVLQHAAMHFAAALFSLPRFKYKRVDGFDLWLRDARDANMWPTALLYGWYMLSLASDFVAADAPLNMAQFQWFTTLINVVMLYSATRTIREDEQTGLYVTRVSNALLVLFSMTLPVLSETLKCWVLANDPGAHVAYVDVLRAYPNYTPIACGTLLGAMYIGNLACALSSAEHYGAITKSQIGTLQMTLVMLLNVIVFSNFLEDGDLARDMLQVVMSSL